MSPGCSASTWISPAMLLGANPAVMRAWSGVRVRHRHPVRRTDAEQLVDRARCQQLAVADDGGRRADLLHLGQDVRAQQHGHAGRPEVADRLPDLADARGVETVRRLVEDEQVRLLEQGRGDREPLLHAERVGLVAVLLAPAELDRLDRLVDSRRRGTDGAREKQQVATTAEVGRELRGLDDRADPADHLRQVPRHRLAEQPHRAARRAGQAEEHPDRRGLAGTVGPEEAVDAAGRHRQVQALYGDPQLAAQATELLAQAGRLDDEVAHPNVPCLLICPAPPGDQTIRPRKRLPGRRDTPGPALKGQRLGASRGICGVRPGSGRAS